MLGVDGRQARGNLDHSLFGRGMIATSHLDTVGFNSDNKLMCKHQR